MKAEYKAYEFSAPLMPLLINKRSLDLLSSIVLHQDYCPSEGDMVSTIMVILLRLPEAMNVLLQSYSFRFAFTCLPYQRQARVVKRMLNTVT